jgi:hypothetical protein
MPRILYLPFALFLPCLAVASRAAEPPAAILLDSMTIDTGAPPPLPDALRAADDSARQLLQFPGRVSARELRALDEAGIDVYTYLPEHAFLVRLPPVANRTALLGKVGARWAGPWHPGYKVGRGVRALTADHSAERGSTRRQLMVQVFPDVPVAEMVESFRLLGVPGIVGWRDNAFFPRIRLLLDADQIARHVDAIARLDGVFSIDLEPRRALLNDTTIWVGQSGLDGGQTTPVFANGVLGQGQVVAVLDTGLDPDMCFFRDDARGLPAINACNCGTAVAAGQRKVLAVDFLWSAECAGGIANNEWDTQDHGTHIAGTVAGDNLANPLAHDAGDGMAPAARLVIQDGGYQVNECADMPGIGCPVVDLNPIFQQAFDQGARIHTNSWGDKENAAIQNDYSVASQDADEFMWSHKDFLLFFAAGNGGNETGNVSTPSTAKSVVSVGSTMRANLAGTLSDFTSCGPTEDGRIKPEIMVPGSDIVSADSDGSATSSNCGTRLNSGTSMATPGAAGLAALIRQYFADGFYPDGAASASSAFAPSAALLRATLINSGRGMADVDPMPADCQGWGRATLDDTLYFPGDDRRLWVDDESSYAAGSLDEERIYSFGVEAGEAFKVTLAWTDFPSTPAAAIHLVNDLDLIVEMPGGVTYRGNVFTAGQSSPGGAPDRRNTLEQVLVATPQAGLATVRVRSHQIPSGPQPYALVVAGDLEPLTGLFFGDGFESGDTTAWTVTQP